MTIASKYQHINSALTTFDLFTWRNADEERRLAFCHYVRADKFESVVELSRAWLLFNAGYCVAKHSRSKANV